MFAGQQLCPLAILTPEELRSYISATPEELQEVVELGV